MFVWWCVCVVVCLCEMKYHVKTQLITINVHHSKPHLRLCATCKIKQVDFSLYKFLDTPSTLGLSIVITTG